MNYQNMGKWIEELTTRSTQEQIKAMHRYQKLIERVLRGELDEQTVREEYMRFARDQATRYAQDLTNLSLNYYNALAQLNQSYNELFFQAVMGGANGRADEEKPEREAQKVPVSLTAPLGHQAQAAFILENKRAEAAEISFLISEFEGDGDSPPFRPPLQISPPRFTLEAQEERKITLTLTLLETLFTVGQTYRATIVVKGHDDLHLLLAVTVEAPAPPPKSPSKKKAAAKKADDLTRIKGIGPAYAHKLQAAGVRTFGALAALDDEQLAAILGQTAVTRAGQQGWREQSGRLVA